MQLQEFVSDKEMIHPRGLVSNNYRIRPVTYGLAFYLLLGALDALSISAVGSALKIAAFIPLGLLLIELKNLRVHFHRLLVLQLCFWLLAMISLFGSISVDRTFDSVKSLSLNLLLVLSLGALFPFNDKELDLLQKAMLWGCWLQIALTLLFADISAAGRLTLRFGESTQDQNNNNTFFLYAFSYHCYHLLCKKERIHSIPVLVIFAMVLISGSRGALLAFAMTFFFHIYIYFKNSAHALRSILIIAIVMVVVAIAFDLILAQMPESVSVRYSWEYLEEKGTTGRSKVWAYLWEQYSNSSMFRILFGHGYGTTSIVNQLNHRVAHNLYLDNLITLGLLGTILQVMSQGVVVWVFYKRRKYALLGAYIGMIGMCMSLSLTACKPLWNMILIALAIDCNESSDCALVER